MAILHEALKGEHLHAPSEVLHQRRQSDVIKGTQAMRCNHVQSWAIFGIDRVLVVAARHLGVAYGHPRPAEAPDLHATREAISGNQWQSAIRAQLKQRTASRSERSGPMTWSLLSACSHGRSATVGIARSGA